MDDLISKNKVIPVVLELNILLANLKVYMTKIKSFQWNVLGENSLELQHKFKEIHVSTLTYCDNVAKRILILGYHPLSKLKDYLSLSSIGESNVTIVKTIMVNKIIADIDVLSTQVTRALKLAQGSDDYGTINALSLMIAGLEGDKLSLLSWQKGKGEYLNTIQDKI